MLTVKITRKYVLIILGVTVLTGFLFLCVFFYTQNAELAQNLKVINIRIADLKNKNDILNDDNQKLKVEISKTNDLLLKASEENKDLESRIISTSNDFKNNIRELEGRIQEDANLISQLKNDNAKLNADNLSLKKELEDGSEKMQSQKEKEESDSIDYVAKMANLKGLMPNDFVGEFKGNEAFLQNCSTPLCAEIILNNEGIKYARLGEWNKAEETFKNILKQYPDYRPAKLNLGLVYNKSRSKREAVNYWLTLFNHNLEPASAGLSGN
jgi:TolA-binding protein